VDVRVEVDLIFIDSTHDYDTVSSDIAYWYPRMKPGGIMVFDDYFDMFPGCIQAVDEFAASIDHQGFSEFECAATIKL
jgi:predicted O-methyltransferase YrrM